MISISPKDDGSSKDLALSLERVEVVQATSLFAAIVSVVALAIIFSGSMCGAFGNISSVVLFMPVGAVFVTAVLAYLISFYEEEEISQSSSSSERSVASDSKKVLSPSDPPSSGAAAARVMAPLSGKAGKASSERSDSSSPLSQGRMEDASRSVPLFSSDPSAGSSHRAPVEESRYLAAGAPPAPIVVPKKEPPPPTPEELFRENLYKVLSRESPLHPEVGSENFDFSKPEFLDLESSEASLSSFLLMMSDFMGLDLSGVATNNSISLSFLITSLVEFNTLKGCECKETEELLASFVETYEVDSMIRQLKKANNVQQYCHGRQQVIQHILQRLGKLGKLILPAGYQAKPGHNLSLELEIMKDGKVQGLITNRGEGIPCHDSGVSRRKKPTKIKLSPITLEELASSHFLETLIDLNQLLLFPTEAGAGIQTETGYQINDVYQILLPAWKAPIVEENSFKHAKQHGSTCAMNVWIALMKERVAGVDGERAKLFLQLKAFELLLKNGDLAKADLNRLRDCFRKVNRLAVKLNRKRELVASLALYLAKISAAYKKKMRDLKGAEKARLSESRPLGNALDPTQKRFQFSRGEQFGVRRYGWVAENNSTRLPPFSRDEAEKYIDSVGRRVWQEQDRGQILLAKNLARQALIDLPGVNDPFWRTPISDHTIKILNNLVTLLMGKKSLNMGPLHMTPNETILYLKMLLIFSIQCRLKGGEVPEEVIYQYLSHTKSFLKENRALFRFTHPVFAKIYRECFEFLKGVVAIPESLNIYMSYDWFLTRNQKEYESISDLRTDIELRFLNDFYHAHEGSLDGELKERYMHPQDEIAKTLCLYSSSVGNRYSPYFLFPTFFDKIPNPEYRPLYCWNSLRSMYVHFTQATYLVGEVSKCEWSKRDEAILYHHIGRVGYGHKAEMVTYHFQLENQRETNRGVFVNNFDPLTKALRDEFFDFFQDDKPYNNQPRKLQNEQLLFQDSRRVEDFNLSPIELQELLSIQTYDETRICQIIHFFSSHFDRVVDPRFRSLFAHLLFALNKEGSRTVLEEVMASHTLVKMRLLQFLNSAIEKAGKVRWLEPQLFFLKTYAEVLSFLVNGSDPGDRVAQDLIEKATSNLSKKLRVLLDKKRLTNEEKEKVAQTILSMAFCFEHEKLKSLLPFCVSAKGKIITEGYRCRFDKLPQAGEDLEWGDYRLETQVSSEGMLPEWVVKHQDYIFERNFKVVVIASGLYEFYDAAANLYRLKTDGNNIHIYRKMGDKWYEYRKDNPYAGGRFPKDNHPCIDGLLALNATVWFSLTSDQAIVLSKKTNELICSVTPEAVCHPKMRLILATDYETPLVEALCRIAKRNHILVWKDPETNIVSRVEIPDYNLVFTNEGNRWKSSLHPGFYIDESHPSVFELEPCTHYLVLVNGKGSRIAIVPTWTMGSGKQNGLMKAKVSVNEIDKPSLFTYPLDEKGRLEIPDSPEKMAYLITLALKKYDYALAERLIVHVQKEMPDWNNRICQWIKDIEVSEKLLRDTHPLAIACRLKLRLMMNRQGARKLDNLQKAMLREDYFDYLELFHHTFGARLSPKEEKRCMRIIGKSGLTLSETEKFQLGLRAEKLQARPLFFDEDNPPDSVYNDAIKFDWISASIEEEMWNHLEHPQPVVFNLRPGRPFISNFLRYYAIARELNIDHPLKQQLIRFLAMSRHSSGVFVNSLHILLVNVINNPQQFPSLWELKQQRGSLHETLSKLKINPSLSHDFFCQQKLSFNFDGQPLATHRVTPFKEQAPFEATAPANQPEAPLPILSSTFMDCPSQLYFVGEKFFIEEDRAQRQKELEEQQAILLQMRRDIVARGEKERDPCNENEFEKLILGVDEMLRRVRADMESKKSSYTLDLSQIDRLTAWLKEADTASREVMSSLKRAIFAIARRYPPELLLEKEGAMLRMLTLREMIVNFGIGNDEAFFRSNPSLTKEDVIELKRLLLEYLQISTEREQFLKMAASLDEVRGYRDAKGVDSKEVAIATKAFVAISQAERQYDGEKEPHLLVFEYFAKLRLRPEQIKALKDLTGSEKDIEFEARTGFGKSKVLIPLWLLLNCLHKKQTMMVLPSSLFVSQYQHLKKVLGRSFDLLVAPITFDRNKANDPNYLKLLNRRIQSTKKGRKVLLTSIQSLHGLTSLKFKEALSLGSTKEAEESQRELLMLRKKISEDVLEFVDESRECFNIRHRFDYAVGNCVGVTPAEIQPACRLYEMIFFKLKLQERLNLEFLPYLQDQRKSNMPQELYERALLPDIARAVMDYFKVEEKWQPAVLQDLTGNYTAACEEFYRSLPKEKLEEYERMRRHLTIHLRRTLFRKCDDSYGFLPNTRLAIPYFEGTPRLNSEFSTVEDYIDFTIQANLKIPFSTQDITEFMNQLKVKMVELGEAVKQTAEYQYFLRLSGALSVPGHPVSSLRDVPESDYEKMATLINGDLALRLQFIETCVLPKIKIYRQKITSTSFNLLRAAHQTQAASGTVSPETLPSRMESMPDFTAVIENLMALWRNSQERIFELPMGGALSKLRSLLTGRKEENVLIDAAGFFRDLQPLQIATEILALRENVNGVLVFDDEGNEWVLERGKRELIPREDSRVRSDDLFMFIRKSKAVGTDLTMPLLSSAIVTVDHDTVRDLFCQATGRMRGLSSGQVAGFAYTVEDKEQLFGNEPPSLPTLFAYTVSNQGKQKGADTFQVLRLFLEDLVDAAFWEGVKKCNGQVKEIQKLYEGLKSQLVKETQVKPLTSLRKDRKLMASKEAVEQLKREFFDNLEQFLAKKPEYGAIFDLNAMKEQFDQFAARKKLPQMLSLSVGEVEESVVEVEEEEVSEEEEEVDEEISNENVEDKTTELPKIRYRPATPEWDGNYAALFDKGADSTLLGIPIHFSPNYKIVAEDAADNARVLKPAYQYLIRKKGNQIEIVLLDLHDARAVLNRMARLRAPTSGECDYWLMSGISPIAYDGSTAIFRLDNEAVAMEPKKIALRILRKMFVAFPRLDDEEMLYLRRLKTNSQDQLEQLISYCVELQKLWPHLAPLTRQCQLAMAPPAQAVAAAARGALAPPAQAVAAAAQGALAPPAQAAVASARVVATRA